MTKTVNRLTDYGPRNPRSGRGGIAVDHRASQVVNQRNPCAFKTLKVATWNVRSLYASGKLANVLLEMENLQIDVLGISDVQWPGSGKQTTNNGTMYYSGNNNETNHRYGVAILVAIKVNYSVVSFTPYSDRSVLLQLQSKKGIVNFIQVYAPTADKEEDEIELFYHDLEQVLKSMKRHHTTIVMGDFNAKVGQGRVDGYVGEYGLGNRNERGDRLIQFCQMEEFVIANTLFKLPKRRLYTWKSPGDTTNRTIRNQIDFVLIRKRFRNSILSAKTYPGADIGSDHNPIVVTLRIKLKLIKKPTQSRIDVKRLREPQTKEQTVKTLTKNLHIAQELNKSSYNIDQKWENIKQAVIKTASENLKPKKRKHKDWMTEEIILLMNERKSFKTKNPIKYNVTDRLIKKKIKEAKERMLHEQCQELEEFEKKYDFFNMHKRIRELTGMKKTLQTRQLRDESGALMTDINQKMQRWTQYIAQLFEDKERTEAPKEFKDDTGPDIIREEVEYAMKQAKSGKSPGPDEVPIELLKIVDTESIDLLLDLFNTIYITGIIPKEWLQSTFILLPKKANAKECNEHRTIALMSHVLKLFLKVIHNRIHKKLDEGISDTQMGFRKGLGTRDALFAVSVLSQRCLDMNQEVYACFIDFEKAFDKVQHNRLKEILLNKNIDSRDIRIICNLYWNQTAKVKVENELTEDIQIRRGVRQGCILSPLLFNLYSEAISELALAEVNEGLIINGEPLNNIRYADDTVLLAGTLEELQHLAQQLNIHCNDYGLKINLKKTKFMVFTKAQNIRVRLVLDNTEIEQISSYKYLGAWITEDTDQTKEIRCRIEIARSIFNRMRKLFCNRNINITLRIRMLRCYIFSTLLYGVEAWTLKQSHIKNLEAFEMWCYRRILKISWTDRKTNAQVLEQLGKQCEVLNSIKIRKLEYLGHIMRGEKYELLRNIMQGKIKGRRSVGRRKISWLRNLREWFGCSSIELFRRVTNKIIIARMISNLR